MICCIYIFKAFCLHFFMKIHDSFHKHDPKTIVLLIVNIFKYLSTSSKTYTFDVLQ